MTPPTSLSLSLYPIMVATHSERNVSGSGKWKHKKWQYEEEMEFLNPYYKHRSTFATLDAEDIRTADIEISQPIVE